MRVDERKGVVGPSIEGRTAVRDDAPPAGTAAPDRVSVSDAARELAGLRAEVGPVDGVRTERVADLRRAIAAGAYRVDPSEVAVSVLRDVLGTLLC
jgi:flagellar biosynthesis anti-sigma factor FlgM